MNFLKNWLTEASFDFVGKRRIAAVMSLVLVVLSWLLFLPQVKGPNWGIDFTGGTELHLKFEEEVSIGDLRESLTALKIPSDAVQAVGEPEDNEFKIRIKDPEFGVGEIEKEVKSQLVSAFGEEWFAKPMEFSAEVGARFVVYYNGDRVLPERVAEAMVGMDGIKVEEGRSDNEVIIKLPGLASQISKQIEGAMDGRAFEVLSVDAVGPKVGASLRRQGFLSLAATLGLVLVYVAFRFDLSFAPGAIVALIHDVSLTVGVFVLLGKEFNLPMIGALLTIVGYSLNDTIVIYDRIRENQTRFSRDKLPQLINTSINETLARTVATSFTTFLAISAFLFIGSPVIRDFAFAMFLGIIFGTYSTIFVASPMIIGMQRVVPKLQALIAIETDEEDETGGIPEQFLSESEKRRRERQRLEKEAESSAQDF